MSQKVLITGYTGFIGSHLARALVGRGYLVLGTGRHSEQSVQGVDHVGYDFSKIPPHKLRGVSAVFHQAANNDTQSSDRENMNEVNYDKPADLFNQAYDAGCRNFIYASTAAIYGKQNIPWHEDALPEPLTQYAISKLHFEDFADEFSWRKKCSVIGLRYCNVYGPGEDHKSERASMIFQLAKQIMEYRVKLFDTGEQKRDWIYVQDVVNANLYAARYGFKDDPRKIRNNIFNISSGEIISYNEIVKILDSVLGTDSDISYIPNPYKNTYQERAGSNIDMARSVLRWKPRYGIRKGITSMIQQMFNSPLYRSDVVLAKDLQNDPYAAY